MNQMKLLAEASESTFKVNGPMMAAQFEIFGYTVKLSETVIVQLLVMLILGLLFFFLGRNLKVKPETKRQAAAEWIVGMFSGMVNDTMGISYKKYTPYIGALFCFSMTSSLMGLLGLRTPTSDISVVGAWALITFVLVQRNRFRTGGIKGYFKAFVQPIPVMLPSNLLGEVTNPLSQGLRHFVNMVSGMVIGGLIYFALGNFAIGLPAVLSLYFDLFSAVIQAYVFTMLTMSYVAMAEAER